MPLGTVGHNLRCDASKQVDSLDMTLCYDASPQAVTTNQDTTQFSGLHDQGDVHAQTGMYVTTSEKILELIICRNFEMLQFQVDICVSNYLITKRSGDRRISHYTFANVRP
jgi:hypothetical protein